MGARINFVFKDGEDENEPSVVLYSHWGADSWRKDLAEAINHARPRWEGGSADYSYTTRMIVSYLLRDDLLSETGYGISATNNISRLGDEIVVINLSAHTLEFDDMSIGWEELMEVCTETALQR